MKLSNFYVSLICVINNVYFHNNKKIFNYSFSNKLNLLLSLLCLNSLLLKQIKKTKFLKLKIF